MSTFFESWWILVSFSKIYYFFYTYIWGSQCKWKTSGSFWTKKRKQTSQLSRFHCLSHGLAVGSSFLTGFQILSGFFPKLTVFWKKTNKQTQAAYCDAAEERISRMINKNKTSSRSSLYLSWKLLFIKLVKTHIDNPF